MPCPSSIEENGLEQMDKEAHPWERDATASSLGFSDVLSLV